MSAASVVDYNILHSCPVQSISSITEGVSTATSSTEEPMQTDEAASAEAAPSEEAAAAMETQAEVNKAPQTCHYIFYFPPWRLTLMCFPGRNCSNNYLEPAFRADV